MSDFLISLIRTWVPIVIGAVVAWLATKGVDLDPETQTGLIVGFTGVVIAVYYAIVRVLEDRFPWFGFLLGSKQTPAYSAK